jgi:hypothetical protein
MMIVGIVMSKVVSLMTFVGPHSQTRRSAGYHGPLRVGIGGPVGSGKTALIEAPCKRLREGYSMSGEGVDQIASFVIEKGGLAKSGA